MEYPQKKYLLTANGIDMQKTLKTRMNPWVSITIIIISLIYMQSTAQEMPPRPISLSGGTINLSFGAFSHGNNGGTVTISPTGVRTATGDIILLTLGYLYFPALFELEGLPGTIVHYLAGPDATLTGSNGGSLTLQVGESYPGDPIIINVAPPGRMQIHIGGTLIVGNALANPAGHYNGSYSVMFIQE
jgi:hypothetical protein